MKNEFENPHAITPLQKQLLFHLPFHPRDISRSKIQALYQTHCNDPDENEQSFCLGYKNNKGQEMKIENLPLHTPDQKI